RRIGSPNSSATFLRSCPCTRRPRGVAEGAPSRPALARTRGLGPSADAGRYRYGEQRQKQQNGYAGEQRQGGRQAPLPLAVRTIDAERRSDHGNPTDENGAEPAQQPPETGQVLDAARRRRNLKETEDEIAGVPQREQRRLHSCPPLHRSASGRAPGVRI